MLAITFVSCDILKDTTKKKPDKRANKPFEKKSTDKRELDGKYGMLGGVGAGTAFSYTQVIQNHGKVRKVIHVPGSDGTFSDDYSSMNDHDEYHNSPMSSDEHDYGSFNYAPTQEPYYGPIYVTAKPVLPVKETHGRAAVMRSNHENVALKQAVPFSYPLFTPYNAGLDKPYTVPVQVGADKIIM